MTQFLTATQIKKKFPTKDKNYCKIADKKNKLYIYVNAISGKRKWKFRATACFSGKSVGKLIDVGNVQYVTHEQAIQKAKEHSQDVYIWKNALTPKKRLERLPRPSLFYSLWRCYKNRRYAKYKSTLKLIKNRNAL